jgi:hypothetical protein
MVSHELHRILKSSTVGPGIMADFLIRGRNIHCLDWTVADLLEFNDFQAKLDELTGSDPMKMKGAAGAAVLNTTIDYVAKQTGTAKEDIMKWPSGMLAEVLNAVIQHNTTPPKVPAVEASLASSQASSTQTIRA